MRASPDSLEAWFHTPLGTATLACERLLAGHLMDELFGYYLIQVGHWGGTEALIESCRVRHHLLVEETPPASVIAPRDSLPVASSSVDVVLLPHTLEFDDNPHGVLREAHRVLINGGHVLLLGFSRYSLWGLREIIRRPPFGELNLLPERRVGDWMRLLGLELVAMERFLYRLPLNYGSLTRRSRWLENWGRSLVPGPWPAAAYAALFRKQALGGRPIRPRWKRSRRRARQAAVPEGWPSNRLQKQRRN
ncbi:class I SAM-dependent methyltransferase [Natronospira bacteriovora]|uniref:Methyltransferase domain-containing protein n=1 Tax=Natronospira bacteriovora TaxID=3069753 RepID=A0ABU0W4S8_9GAMM|nr:methyltransferase domain-containing protein [Natronospira sp. AB-CW4]MDQ2068954.1 methyltransferase domain-containing protein [Natronospira sp. AB-CW4]